MFKQSFEKKFNAFKIDLIGRFLLLNRKLILAQTAILSLLIKKRLATLMESLIFMP